MALETPIWLNLRFVEEILRKSEGDNSIQMIDISSKPATNKGDNYASDMIRINVEFSRKMTGHKITEKKSMVLKIFPLAESIRRNFMLKSRFFETEISMMTDTLEKMNKLLGPKNRLSAKSLYVQREDPIFIVMEDLSALDFRMADRMVCLDLDHCILALRGLARFHASSVAVCEQEPHRKQLYSRGMCSNEHPPEMELFFKNAVKTLAEEIKYWPEVSRYAKKIAKLPEHIYQIGIKAFALSENEFNVINHGDFWINNMLFNYDNNGKPIDHIFVDFQLCVYTSPALDLLYFLNTSASLDVLENNRSLLLTEYHSTLISTMQQLNCKTQPPTMEELKTAIKQRASYGMIAAFSVLPLVLCHKDDVKDVDEMLSKNGSFASSVYKDGLYRKLITKRLPLYEEQGLFEV